MLAPIKTSFKRSAPVKRPIAMNTVKLLAEYYNSNSKAFEILVETCQAGDPESLEDGPQIFFKKRQRRIGLRLSSI
jgi:hypothetical protein